MNDVEFRTGVIKPFECMKEGWELIKDDYWTFVGVTLVGMLIAGFIPLGLGIGAMFCGIYLVVMKRANGEHYEFGDLFKGFNFFVPGLIVTAALIVPVIISVVISYASVIAFVVTSIKPNGQIDEAQMWAFFATLSLEMIVLSLISGCIHALLMFTYPLIVERGLSGVDALKLSVRAVWANLSGVVGIIMVEFLMGIVGYMLLLVGVYLALPIMFAGVFVAYRRVFPNAPTPGYGAVAPNIYQ